MENGKISVILPVYRVEKYLPGCMDSLLHQTYTDLEIILVDDGSPDGSGALCDAFARQDSRVKVIHKENGGVSSARNAGLDVATGDYIGFVDPDDWVDRDMFAYLAEGLERQGADVAVCGFIKHYHGTESVVSCGSEQVMSGKDVDRKTLDTLLMPNCWNKLSRRELWDELRFPGMKIGEDQWNTFLLAERAKKIVCLPESKYHYIFRDGSAMLCRTLGKWLDNYRSSKAWHDEMAPQLPGKEELLRRSCLDCARTIWCVAWRAPRRERRAAMSELREISRFCAPWIPDELARGEMGFTGRIATRMICYPYGWALWAAGMADRLYQKKHGVPL